jgi:hypothetical protein
MTPLEAVVVLYIYDLCFYDVFHVLWLFLTIFGSKEFNVYVYACMYM